MILPGARAMGEYDCADRELHGGIVSQKNLLHEGVKDMKRAEGKPLGSFGTVEGRLKNL
jgi:hypothetical protein